MPCARRWLVLRVEHLNSTRRSKRKVEDQQLQSMSACAAVSASAFVCVYVCVCICACVLVCAWLCVCVLVFSCVCYCALIVIGNQLRGSEISGKWDRYVFTCLIYTLKSAFLVRSYFAGLVSGARTCHRTTRRIRRAERLVCGAGLSGSDRWDSGHQVSHRIKKTANTAAVREALI